MLSQVIVGSVPHTEFRLQDRVRSPSRAHRRHHHKHQSYPDVATAMPLQPRTVFPDRLDYGI